MGEFGEDCILKEMPSDKRQYRNLKIAENDEN